MTKEMKIRYKKGKRIKNEELVGYMAKQVKNKIKKFVECGGFSL